MANAQKEPSDAEKAILAWAEKHGVTVESEFVPWSQSRAKDDCEEYPTRSGTAKRPRLSLQWRVTVKRAGRAVLTTEYGAGIAHAPAYKQAPPKTFEERRHYDARLAFETEEGFASSPRFSTWAPADVKPLMVRDESKPAYGDGSGGPKKRVKLEPGVANVLWSLSLDSSVLEESGFEGWAESLGYETDSRKAESIYRECLEIALKLRAGLGAEALDELREAAQDF